MPVKMSFENSSFRTGIIECSKLSPLSVSGLIAVLYIVLFSGYIWYSGVYAARLAESVPGLQHLELIKGIIFVFLTGVLLFIFFYKFLKKISQMDNQIIAQNKALIASERVSTAGIFASSICHDVNNIMTVIYGNLVWLVQKNSISAEDKRHIQDALSASSRLMDVMKNMMAVGNEKQSGEFAMVDMVRLVKEAIKFSAMHKKVKSCQVTSSLPESVYLNVDETSVGRMLLNLVINAADATDHKGHIHIELIDKPDEAILEVHDNGPGIKPEDRDKVFQPFYTTKASGNGLGLLSLKVCAIEHDAKVSIMHSKLGGACFQIVFKKQKPARRKRSRRGSKQEVSVA